MFRDVFLILLLTLFPMGMACSVSAAQQIDTGTEQRIPFKKSDESASGIILKVVGGLIVVSLIGIGVIYALKRYLPTTYRSGFTDSTQIKVVEIRRLTPKTTLFLIELNGAHLLLGQNGDRITTLYTGPKPVDVVHNDDV